MLTFQDLQEINTDSDAENMEFVRSVINNHKSSILYQTAVIADEYFVCSLLKKKKKNKEDAYYYYNSEIIEKSMIDVKKMYPSSEYTIVDGYLPNDMTVIWKKSSDSGTQTP